MLQSCSGQQQNMVGMVSRTVKKTGVGRTGWQKQKDIRQADPGKDQRYWNKIYNISIWTTTTFNF
jgi:hypothetical protein